MIQSIIVKFDRQYAVEIKKIRNAVFTREQQIDEDLDFEGKDPDAIHVLVMDCDQVVGTGRMLTDGHIGRVAVLKEHRGKGFGANAIITLIDEARRLGMKKDFLGAQIHAVEFYKKLGFSEYGAPFLDAGIDHIHMEKFI